ncbi:MAG: asparagine synthase (glutamine-hydrolyzing) [Planctomycetes bacterium]|nr:asparagine synthase (glutamine-hydrolyzing) [Planctomycetota bacterium]
MCGFTGFWGAPTQPAEALCALVGRMADTLAHRGPDDRGVWADARSGVALGFRRLSIVDLSIEGHQPMSSADGRHTLVFNGEIYNFVELREELEREGVAFRGHSDSEVLLGALNRWGTARTLERVVGMFAFACWDQRERRLVLARDRLGKKPLYYGSFGTTLLFGSELKALVAHPQFAGELDREALALFFRHNYVPAPFSIWRGVKKLRPGTWLEFSAAESGCEHVYWDALELATRVQPLPMDALEAEEALLEHLRTAVRQRLFADVPLGAFLSGGIDSSLIVALMREASPDPVRTFTIGFREQGFDEAQYARKVATHLGTEHTELYLSAQEALEVVPHLSEVWDEPFADSSQIPTLLVSRLARTQVRVALSGDGGDELFGGYARYHLAQRWRRVFAVVPGGVARGLAQALERAGARVPLRLSRLPRRTLRLAQLFGARSRTSFYRALISHWDQPERLVLGAHEPTTLLEHNTLAGRTEFIEEMMLLDLVTYLPGDILCKVDRASMSQSLEARAPLLDQRLVEFSWRLPLALRVGPAPGKQLLRRLLARYVPLALFERPKQGFSIPISQWLRGPLRGWAEELLDERRLAREGVLDPTLVRAHWREHRDGRADWGYLLWDVLQFQAWKERWLPECGGGP